MSYARHRVFSLFATLSHRQCQAVAADALFARRSILTLLTLSFVVFAVVGTPSPQVLVWT